MRLLTGLGRYLLTQTQMPREMMQVFTDRGRSDLQLRDLGNGLELARIQYTGIISIENYPYDAYALLAHVITWLADHDPERATLQLPQPEFDVEINNELTVNVEFMIDFDEPIELIPNEDGAIALRHQRYRIEPVNIDIAQTLEKMERKRNDAE